MKKILIFNVNWLGDVLFSTAVIRNIRHNYPGGFISCIIPSRCYPILKDNPHLDEILIFDEKEQHKGFLAQMEFIRLLKSKKFDAVFLLHRSFTRALICRLAGIPERIGYSTHKRAFLLTKKIAFPKKDSMHRIDYYLNIIEKSGLIIKDRHTDFFINKEDSEFVEDIFIKNSVAKQDFVAAINPGGNWLPKRWPKEYWAVLADRLISEFGAKVFITGSHKDLSLATHISQEMKEKPIIACGVLNIKQLGALLMRLDLFISADTGPIHIANALEVRKIIALFGPTAKQITGPRPEGNTIVLQKQIGCNIPCYEVNCKDNRCMKAITPDEVVEAIRGDRC